MAEGKKLIKKIWAFGVSLYFLLIISILNFKTPLIGEDFALSIPYATYDIPVIQKIPLIFAKIHYQSTVWNARLGEQLAIVFLGFNKVIFNIVNILVTIGFIYLILVYAEGKILKVNLKVIYLMAVCASLLLIIPIAGDIFLWISTATNYLWGVSLLVLFFLPYRFWYSGRDLFDNKPKILQIVFSILAFFAGMTNENTVIAVIVMILAGFLLIKIKLLPPYKYPNWYWRNLGLLSAGYCYLLFSPSTKFRNQYYIKAYGITENGISFYLNKCVKLIGYYFQNTKTLLFILGIFIVALLVIYALNHSTFKEGRKNHFPVLLFLFATSLVSVFALIFAPYFESRALFFHWFWLFVLLMYCTKEIIAHRKELFLMTLPIICFGLFQSGSIYKCTNELYFQSNIRHNYILSEVNRGSRVISVPGIKNTCPNIFSDREGWLVSFNHDEVYYDVDDIQITNP